MLEFLRFGRKPLQRVLIKSQRAQMFAPSAGPSSHGATINAKLSALVSKGYAGFPMTDVDWQAAAAEASFGIGDSIATKIGWEHRQ
jgi:hypothetical protein